MKTIKLKLYDYDELSPKAKAKALADFNKDHYDPMLGSHLVNIVKEDLDERKVKYDTDSIDVSYSLGYSQGDGLMFEGRVQWRGRTLKISHSGHYSHEKSRTIEVVEGEELSEAQMAQFEVVYEAICRNARDVGYAEIEYQSSEEYFAQLCEANEWTFEENGTMRNA